MRAALFVSMHVSEFGARLHTWHKLNPGTLTPRSSQRSPCLPTTGRRGCEVLIQCPAADLHSLSSQQQQDGLHCPSPSAADLFLQRLQGLLETERVQVCGGSTGLQASAAGARHRVVSERQQCFRHSDWQCAGLMRSAWIMSEPADIPHHSLSSMKHNTKAQSLHGFTGANKWLRIQPHISNSLYCVAKVATFKLDFETTWSFFFPCSLFSHNHARAWGGLPIIEQLLPKDDAATLCNLHVSSVWKWALFIGLRSYDHDMLQNTDTDMQLSLYHHLHMLACSHVCSCYVRIINVMLQDGYANNAAHLVQAYGFCKASWDNLNCNCS